MSRRDPLVNPHGRVVHGCIRPAHRLHWASQPCCLAAGAPPGRFTP